MGNPLNVRGGNGKCGIVRFFAGVPGTNSRVNVRSLAAKIKDVVRFSHIMLADGWFVMLAGSLFCFLRIGLFIHRACE